MSFVFACKACKYKTNKIMLYVSHYKLHTNVPNLSIPCGLKTCSQVFKTYGAFKTHVVRDHERNCTKVDYTSGVDMGLTGQSYRCMVMYCKEKFLTINEFLRHIKEHIKVRAAAACPFNRCGKHFADVTVSTFNSHISRSHRDKTGLCIDEKYCLTRNGDAVFHNEKMNTVEDADSIFTTCSPNVMMDNEVVNDPSLSLSDYDEKQLLLSKLAMFSTCKLNIMYLRVLCRQ
jgi:hypothetical protein